MPSKKRITSGGGWRAILYSFQKSRQMGGLWGLWKAMRSKNACKTCALGMGGQKGGMVNEAGHFPEVCKKSLQAQVGDMKPGLDEGFFREHSIAAMRSWSSAEFESRGRLAFPIVAREGATHFERAHWSEALDATGAAFRAARPEEVFVYSSGRASNEAAFLLQLVARAYGTANVHNCSFYCHQASGVALGFFASMASR